jgi:hypothetical protein
MDRFGGLCSESPIECEKMPAMVEDLLECDGEGGVVAEHDHSNLREECSHRPECA